MILYAILYEDGSVGMRAGPLCKSRECAVNSINPLEGTKVLGIAEFDSEPGSALMFWKRHQIQSSETHTNKHCTTGLYTAPPQPQDAARDREDAQRYRWLRNPKNVLGGVTPMIVENALDAAIDAARVAEK